MRKKEAERDKKKKTREENKVKDCPSRWQHS